MPRVSEAEKQKSHTRIVDAAAKLIREQGVETTSVADVMKSAGMTHGGFYRHFSNKDVLVSTAFKSAVDAVVLTMEAADDNAVLAKAREDYIKTYLSNDHVDDRANGCPLAALGGELARSEGAERQVASDTVGRVAGLLADTADKQSGYQKLAMLVGAVTLARLVDDAAERQEILDAAISAVKLKE
jgi:TetR/AcrR family transcriptional repressor of nem operon